MTGGGTTIETTDEIEDVADDRVAGLLIVGAHALEADGRAAPIRAIALTRGAVVIGRGDASDVRVESDRLSRRHTRFSRDADGALVVEDLGSKNGTFVDRERIDAPRTVAGPRSVVRLGDHFVLQVDDVTLFVSRAVSVNDGVVVGPVLGATLDAVRASARADACLHLRGETGAGKELLARAFADETFARSPRRTTDSPRPFVAVNCATIQPELAERLLFGTKRGAYSSADADADGYVQAADGGTLFLDEVVELDGAIQAKLLRVLETGEVFRLGATKGTRVSVRVCTATHADLRAEVARGRFRADLYYRLGRPLVVLPPLRDRREEIPYLIAQALRTLDVGLSPHVSLVETCLLREWPGNVRELLLEVRSAAHRARGEGADVVRDKHLADDAGREVERDSSGAGAADPDRDESPSRLPADDVIEAALAAQGGNVAATARALGVHRTQIRRWMARRAPG